MPEVVAATGVPRMSQESHFRDDARMRRSTVGVQY